MSEEVQASPEIVAPAENDTVQNEVAPATTETEAKAPEDQPKEAPKPGKNSFDRKIDRLYKTAAEQKARADYLERQLEDLKPKQTQDTGAPRIEDFDDIDAYTEAKAEHIARQKLMELHQSQQQEMGKKQAQTFMDSWESKVTKAYEKYDDFDEVVGDLKPTNAFTVAVMDSDMADDVAYYLGKNQQEAIRIAQLPPLRIAKEIAKLEMKLANEPQDIKKPSQAPEPISPLKGKSGSNVTSSFGAQDFKTFLKMRNRELGRSKG